MPNAERIAARAAPSLPRKRVDPLVQNQSTKAIRDEVAAKIEALQAEAKREQEAMLRRAKRAAEEGRKEDAKRAKDKARVIAEEFSERKERITTRFAFDAPCRKDEGLVGTGELFDVRSRGDEAWITINTATSFYKHVYNAAKQEADLVDLLDLLIMAMAYAEHMMYEDEASKAAWQNARREVSTLAETMVGTMAVTALGGLSANHWEVRPDGNPSGALRDHEHSQSARLDITEEECILEALDNSFDAGARRVRIEISKTERDEPLVIIIDDGVGIPARHVDDDGVEHQGIPYVLAYGGRIPHEGKRGPIGKFGWGLSQAASSISRRTEVYTKTATDDQWRYCYYDFEELEQRENCYLPIEKPRNPPWIDVGHTGTIVAFHMDRSDVHYIGSLVNCLETS